MKVGDVTYHINPQATRQPASDGRKEVAVVHTTSSGTRTGFGVTALLAPTMGTP